MGSSKTWRFIIILCYIPFVMPTDIGKFPLTSQERYLIWSFHYQVLFEEKDKEREKRKIK